MSLLLHGDCLEQMKGIDTGSVDFIFCDLPYGQTSCKWDTIIPWEPFWNEIMRVKKLNTPIFFTTTTKFGVELINNAPKKCPFRYDLVWVKSAPAGFLSAKKMPMRKHEMVYAFYEKLPFYDLSSHKHKFIKDGTKSKEDNCYGIQKLEEKKSYDPPLPTSVVKEQACYGEAGSVCYKGQHNLENGMALNQGGQKYDPPLPTSVVKEPEPEPEPAVKKVERKSTYGNIETHDLVIGETTGQPRYDPPLPTSVVKEEGQMVKDFTPNKNGNIYDCPDNQEFAGRNGAPRYDPPLPTSMLEIKSTRGKHSTEKPVALMEWLLKYYSKEGDVVLDPTMGSGSTGVACKNMNRNFIGIEKDPEIFQVAVNRIED